MRLILTVPLSQWIEYLSQDIPLVSLIHLFELVNSRFQLLDLVMLLILRLLLLLHTLLLLILHLHLFHLLLLLHVWLHILLVRFHHTRTSLLLLVKALHIWLLLPLHLLLLLLHHRLLLLHGWLLHLLWWHSSSHLKRERAQRVGEYTYTYSIQKDMHQRAQQGEVPRLRDRIRIGECEMAIFHMWFSSQRAKRQEHLKSQKDMAYLNLWVRIKNIKTICEAYVNVWKV